MTPAAARPRREIGAHGGAGSWVGDRRDGARPLAAGFSLTAAAAGCSLVRTGRHEKERVMRRWALASALLWVVLSTPMVVHAASRAERAEKLFASARRRIAVGSHEQRQFAITELEEAEQLDPGRIEIALTLGEMYFEADLLLRARQLAARLTSRDSANAGGWLLAGRVWRRYWLTEANETARDRAIRCFSLAARTSPRDPTGWLMLVPLLVDADELDAAVGVAAFAARAAPGDPEPQVQMAALAQRTGDLETAQRLFDG